MTSYIDKSAWARQHLSRLLGEEFEIESVPAGVGDFGNLDGFQFNSDKFGGFVYFWSSGNIEFHLVDYERGNEVVPITLVQGNEYESTEAAIGRLTESIARMKTQD
jgi:hypothetical protein